MSNPSASRCSATRKRADNQGLPQARVLTGVASPPPLEDVPPVTPGPGPPGPGPSAATC